MTAPCAKHALFCFATRGFNFATRKTNLDTPEAYAKHALFCFATRGFNFSTKKTNLDTPEAYTMNPNQTAPLIAM